MRSQFPNQQHATEDLPVPNAAFLLKDLGTRRSRPLHVALVGTFSPRKCGIATFTTDIHEQLGLYHPEIALDVYALDRNGSGIVYDPAHHIIIDDDNDGYERAADRINASGVDCAWIQHEFGIFGGEQGQGICTFVDRITVPIVFTFHTVLADPSPLQRRILEHLISRASRIMVMSRYGRDLLITHYNTPADLIEIVPHGAPDRPFGREEEFKNLLGLSGHDILMTFGLLSPGKGLECVIEALPAVVARHSNVLYRIVGATHPNLVAAEGEQYRDKLKLQAIELGVEAHISWVDRFLDTEELLDQLESCDIYVTPYLNLQQSTSGTLSYAVALGKAVISTPYVHARELLADGAGVLIEPNSSAALAEAINDLLDDREQLIETKKRAYAKGRSTIWPQFAQSSAALLNSAVGQVSRKEHTIA